MIKTILKTISKELKEMGINYHYMQYNTDAPTYPYWIGSYAESGEMYEDGNNEFTFTLSGFDRGNSWDNIETSAEKISKKWLNGENYMVDGCCVYIEYTNTIPLQEEDHELKRLVMSLKIKTWRNE